MPPLPERIRKKLQTKPPPCKACGGTGTSSQGKACYPCDGTGHTREERK